MKRITVPIFAALAIGLPLTLIAGAGLFWSMYNCESGCESTKAVVAVEADQNDSPCGKMAAADVQTDEEPPCPMAAAKAQDAAASDESPCEKMAAAKAQGDDEPPCPMAAAKAKAAAEGDEPPCDKMAKDNAKDVADYPCHKKAKASDEAPVDL